MGFVLGALRFEFPRNAWNSTSLGVPNTRIAGKSSQFCFSTGSERCFYDPKLVARRFPGDGASAKAKSIPSVSFSPASHKAEPSPTVFPN